MGMDIYGISPTSKKGEYFRRGGESWEPLAMLVTRLCPKETVGCKYWRTNDGDGLVGVGACDLADALQAKINQGAVRAYIKIFNAKLKAMPNEPCRLCNGTGIRHDEPGDPKKKYRPMPNGMAANIPVLVKLDGAMAVMGAALIVHIVSSVR